MKKRIVKFLSIFMFALVLASLGLNCFADFMTPILESLREAHEGFVVRAEVDGQAEGYSFDPIVVRSYSNYFPMRYQPMESDPSYSSSFNELYYGSDSFVGNTFDNSINAVNGGVVYHHMNDRQSVRRYVVEFNPFVWNEHSTLRFYDVTEETEFHVSGILQFYDVIDDEWVLRTLEIDEDTVYFDFEDNYAEAGMKIARLDLVFLPVDEDFVCEDLVIETGVTNGSTAYPATPEEFNEVVDASFLESVFGWVDDFFAVELFGGISLGLILSFVLVIPIVLWILKLVAGG